MAEPIGELGPVLAVPVPGPAGLQLRMSLKVVGWKRKASSCWVPKRVRLDLRTIETIRDDRFVAGFYRRGRHVHHRILYRVGPKLCRPVYEERVCWVPSRAGHARVSCASEA